MEQSHPNYGLTRSKEEGMAEEEFVNLLPRAVLRTNSFILLDGEWKFELDTHDHGILDSWHLGHQYTDTAQCPVRPSLRYTNSR